MQLQIKNKECNVGKINYELNHLEKYLLEKSKNKLKFSKPKLDEDFCLSIFYNPINNYFKSSFKGDVEDMKESWYDLGSLYIQIESIDRKGLVLAFDRNLNLKGFLESFNRKNIFDKKLLEYAASKKENYTNIFWIFGEKNQLIRYEVDNSCKDKSNDFEMWKERTKEFRPNYTGWLILPEISGLEVNKIKEEIVLSEMVNLVLD